MHTTNKTSAKSTKPQSTGSRPELDLTTPVKVRKSSLGESPLGRYMLTINAHHETSALVRVDPAFPRSFSTRKVIRKGHENYDYYPDHDNRAKEKVEQLLHDERVNCLMIGVSYEACAELHELAQQSPENAFKRLVEMEEEGAITEPTNPYCTSRYALVCAPFREAHLKFLINQTLSL
jgi:hypothetical protein